MQAAPSKDHIVTAVAIEQAPHADQPAPAFPVAVSPPEVSIAENVLPEVSAWGWLPVLSVVSATGLLCVSLGYHGGWNTAPWALPLFWVGLLTIFVPVSVRLLSSTVSRRERVGTLLLLALTLYLVKVMQSPLSFTLFDELLHWRTTSSILETTHLFQKNSLLPVSPLYPGMENITSAVVDLTGLSIYHAGLLVIGVARVVLVLCLYLFYEHVSMSARIASFATMLYMANPNFLFFDAQFAYESLALAFVTLMLYNTVRAAHGRTSNRVGRTITAMLALSAVVVTHHVTSFLFLAFLGVWVLARAMFRRFRRTDGPRPGGMALLAFVLVLTWTLYVASLVVSYLSAPIRDSITGLIGLILREQQSRQLFQGYAGQVNPLWERIVGLASVGLVVLLLPLGILQVWQRYRYSSIVFTMALVTCAYPAVLVLRLTQFGSELGSRTSAYIFIPISLTLAIGVLSSWRACFEAACESLAFFTLWLNVKLTRFRRLRDNYRLHTLTLIPVRVASRLRTPRFTPRQSHWLDRSRTFVFVIWAGVIFAGGVVTGSGPTARILPGPYRVSADSRSIEPEGIAVAEWARSFLGPGNRIVTDRTNKILMGSYGDQYVVNGLSDHLDVSVIIVNTQISTYLLEILQRGQIRYVVVDRRLGEQIPVLGLYVEQGETDGFHHTTPLDQAALNKFDGVKGVLRVFDSGDIVIYDVRGLYSGS